MWRRGERLYALLVFVVVALEALVLGGLALIFSGRYLGLWGYPLLRGALWQALIATALALAVLSAYVLIYHAYTAARERGGQGMVELWLARFTQALFGEAELPPPPWPPAAVAALLNLREIVQGEPAERVSEWLRQSRPPWMRALRGLFSSRPARLEALEALAQARLPESLEAILPYLQHPDPVIRLAAARAAARVARGQGRARLAEALLKAELPKGALLEALVLLEQRAGPVLKFLLMHGDSKAAWAALEALGRLKLRAWISRALPYLKHPDPELKAAAMRAFWRLRYPPKGYEPAVLAALKDEQEFVRLNAVRLAALFGSEAARQGLWKALFDPSFYVRRAAAEGLKALDGDLLRAAAHSHPDRYGRAMAEQVLLEAVWT